MKHILRNRRKMAPQSSLSTQSTPRAELLRKLENHTTNGYTDYTDMFTLSNQKYIYRSQIRTSILDFGVATEYFLIPAILLAKNVYCLIVTLLIEPPPQIQCCRSGHVGNLGNLGNL